MVLGMDAIQFETDADQTKTIQEKLQLAVKSCVPAEISLGALHICGGIGRPASTDLIGWVKDREDECNDADEEATLDETIVMTVCELYNNAAADENYTANAQALTGTVPLREALKQTLVQDDMIRGSAMRSIAANAAVDHRLRALENDRGDPGQQNQQQRAEPYAGGNGWQEGGGQGDGWPKGGGKGKDGEGKGEEHYHLKFV